MAVDVRVEGSGADGAVVVRFTGWDRVWALSSGVRLALADIVAARCAPRASLVRELGWRLGGTYLPRLVAAGRYSVPGRRGCRQLWLVYRDPQVLVIDTRLDRPARVALTHPDAPLVAAEIGAAAGLENGGPVVRFKRPGRLVRAAR